MKLHDIHTPAVVIRLQALKENILDIQKKADANGVKLRPHIKTHKIPEIAKMQIDAGAIGITCAKPSEARVMAENGIKDILIAYPIVQEYKIEDALSLPAKVYLAFDSLYGAENINRVAEKRREIADVYMIVDTGLKRDGVASPDAAVSLATSIRGLQNIRLMGILTHEGQTYIEKDAEGIISAGKAAAQKMLDIRDALVSAGFEISVVSTGNTPTAYYPATLPGITEWRPGQYVFYDTGMYCLGVPIENCALTVLTTVVSHSAEKRYIIDAGSKVFSSDRSGKHEGFGIVKGNLDAIIERVNEEHGVIEAAEGSFSLGQIIEVIPNHCCTVVNLAESVYVISGDEVVDTWAVAARAKVV